MLAEPSARHKVHPNPITKWKCQAAAGMVEVFSGKPGRRDGSHEAEIKELHAKIGEAERRGQAERLRAVGSGDAVRKRGPYYVKRVYFDEPDRHVWKQSGRVGRQR